MWTSSRTSSRTFKVSLCIPELVSIPIKLNNVGEYVSILRSNFPVRTQQLHFVRVHDLAQLAFLACRPMHPVRDEIFRAHFGPRVRVSPEIFEKSGLANRSR